MPSHFYYGPTYVCLYMCVCVHGFVDLIHFSNLFSLSLFVPQSIATAMMQHYIRWFICVLTGFYGGLINIYMNLDTCGKI